MDHKEMIQEEIKKVNNIKTFEAVESTLSSLDIPMASKAPLIACNEVAKTFQNNYVKSLERLLEYVKE